MFKRLRFLEYYEDYEIPAALARVRRWRDACVAHPAAQHHSHEELIKLYYDYSQGGGNGTDPGGPQRLQLHPRAPLGEETDAATRQMGPRRDRRRARTGRLMSKPLDSFAGKTALVTGAVSGLGFGIAQALAGEGVRLALGYRSETDREAAARWFRDAGHDAPLFVPLDVADRAAWAAARETVEREFGKLHILVNNAGISVFGPMDQATYADWDWILGVNLGGVINGLVTFLPHMEAHGETGHVVNVASMAAFLAGPQAGIYTASKFAVRGLTEACATRWRRPRSASR